MRITSPLSTVFLVLWFAGCSSGQSQPEDSGDSARGQAAEQQDELAAFKTRHQKLTDEVRVVADKLIAALNEDGRYWVKEGVYRYFTIGDCVALVDIAGSCYGNNPSSPYGNYWLPAAPNEWHDPETIRRCEEYDWVGRGYSPEDIEIFSELGINSQMRPDEAIIFLGVTPPRAKYFSFRSYIYDRYDQASDSRTDVFAALGDSLNHHIINTSGDSPFHEKTAVITTADTNMDRFIRSLLAEDMEGQINTDIIPTELSSLGYGPNKDNFVMLVRTAFFAHKAVGKAYMEDPRAVVIRVVPKGPVGSIPYEPFPELVQETKAGIPEIQKLARPFASLVAAVTRSVGQLALPLKVQAATLLHGPTCIRKNYPCYGDNYDAAYLISPNMSLGDETGDFAFYVVGVNHTVTGNAEYTNLTLMNSSTLTGIDAFTDQDFAGSIDPFLNFMPPRKRAAVQALRDHFYVMKFARSCGDDPYCMPIPREGSISIKNHEKMRVIARAYIKPGTVRGPDYHKLIKPRIIRFRDR